MTRQFEGTEKEMVDQLVDYAADDCGTRARPALLLNAARLITSQAAEIERLREALERARWYVEAYDTPEHNPEQQAALTAIDAYLTTGAAHE